VVVPAPRRPARPGHVAAGERRSWLSTATAALAVSALGFALAGSITPLGSAESRPTAPGAGTRPPVTQVATPTPDPSLLETFQFGGDGGEPLRKAIVAERAAQRAEELAKDAEAVSRAATQASKKVREEGLSETERATQAKGAELAAQALERAAAARGAAVAARTAAEAAALAAAEGATTQPSPPPAATPPTTPSVPDTTVASTGGVSPVPGAVVGASFGQYGLWSRYHTGLDFRAAYGVPIRAVESGKVLYAGSTGSWAGNHVAVQHGDGMTTMSSHMSSMTVSAGQTVAAGQVIGYVGQTGRAFGAHLHFELYPAGVKYGDVYRAVDPIPWLRSAGVNTR